MIKSVIFGMRSVSGSLVFCAMVCLATLLAFELFVDLVMTATAVTLTIMVAVVLAVKMMIDLATFCAGMLSILAGAIASSFVATASLMFTPLCVLAVAGGVLVLCHAYLSAEERNELNLDGAGPKKLDDQATTGSLDSATIAPTPLATPELAMSSESPAVANSPFLTAFKDSLQPAYQLLAQVVGPLSDRVNTTKPA